MTKSLPPKSLVLYADDDRDDIELIREAFSEFAYTVELLTFEDSRKLISYLEHLPPLQPTPCLIILDINMPLINGKETLSKIRQMQGFEKIPVVLFSTSTLPSEALFAKSLDAGFVTKPLHAEQIHQILHQLIEHCSDEVQTRIRQQRG